MAVRLDHNFPAWCELPRACSPDHRPVQLALSVNPVSGGDSGGETPVPIPNTAVKPSSADGTARSPCGRVGRRRILLREPGPACWWGLGFRVLTGRAMRRLAVLLAPILWLSTARAAEVSFPLTVDYALLGRALRETLTADQTGDIVL